MVTPNKQRTLTKLMSLLSKLPNDRFPRELTVLDHLLLGIIHENGSPLRAFEAYEKLLAAFHDLNELRVSHPREICEFLDSIPDGELKSKRVLATLQFIFETTYSFDLESMKRKPLKQAQRQLSKITGVTPFAVAATVQRALGGHAMPIDDSMAAVLRGIHLVAAEDPIEKVRADLEHVILKTKGESFCFSLSELAADEAGRRDVIAQLAPAAGRSARGGASRAAEETAAAVDPSASSNGGTAKRPATSRKSSQSRSVSRGDGKDAKSSG